MIPHARHEISDHDVEAVKGVLRSDRLTSGPMVDMFEAALAREVGASEAVVCSSGTAATHMLAMIFRPRVVQVPSIAFVSAASVFMHTDNKAVEFVDVDPSTGLLVQPSGAHIVIPVHLGGRVVPFEDYWGNIIIEDGAQAFGSFDEDGNPVGSCTKSVATIFSFHASKPLTTGEGGAVTTNDPYLANSLRKIRNHGFDSDHAIQGQIGLNYRLTDVQCALGLSQLKFYKERMYQRQDITRQYDILIGGMDPGKVGPVRWNTAFSSAHLYNVLVEDRDGVRRRMREAGVETQIHFRPLHRQLAFVGRHPSVPGAEEYGSRCLSLPLFSSMTRGQIDRVVAALELAL